MHFAYAYIHTHKNIDITFDIKTTNLSILLLDNFNSIRLCNLSEIGKVLNELNDKSSAMRLEGMPLGRTAILF
jgi:hypothetical protein